MMESGNLTLHTSTFIISANQRLNASRYTIKENSLNLFRRAKRDESNDANIFNVKHCQEFISKLESKCNAC